MIASLVALALVAQPLPPPDPAPEAAAAEFLDAFRSMDQARFDRFFAPDVTMFFPDGPFPAGRIEGRDAVLAAFDNLFRLARERGRTALAIAPVGQRVQRYGEMAIVTFQLDGGDDLGRRSIVLRRTGGDWRIVHFHASTRTAAKPAGGAGSSDD